MSFPPGAKRDFEWWLSHIPDASCPIRSYCFVREISSDASLTGWGGACLGVTTGGRWSPAESHHHINFIELRAARLALQSFAGDLSHCEILLRLDNTTAVAYVNKMGGILSRSLHEESRRLWQWCERRSIRVFASYIPSALNSAADKASRNIDPDTEWSLNPAAFQRISHAFGTPIINLFASAENAKCVSVFPGFRHLQHTPQTPLR